jgi:ABC-type transporter lipoprotein component MlaA
VKVAKQVFKSIAVAEPRARAAAKESLTKALDDSYKLIREAIMARAESAVDATLLSAAERISTVRILRQP